MPRNPNRLRTDSTSGLSYRVKKLPSGTSYREYQAPASSRVNNDMYRSPYEGADLNALIGWGNQQAQNPQAARNNPFFQTLARNADNLIAQENQKYEAQKLWLNTLETQQATRINAAIQQANVERLRLANAGTATHLQKQALEQDYGTSDPEQLKVIHEAYQNALNNAAKPGGGLAIADLVDRVATMKDVRMQQGLLAADAKKQAEIQKNKFDIKTWAMRSLADPTSYASFGIAPLAKLGYGEITGKATHTIGDSMVNGELKGLGYVTEHVLQPAQSVYYAAQYSRFHGGTVGDQFRAAIGGAYQNLPAGLGDKLNRTINTKEAATAAFKTDTRAEREALTKAGQMLSFGNELMGYGGDLRGQARQNYLNEWRVIQGMKNAHNASALQYTFPDNPMKKASDGGWVHAASTGFWDGAFTTAQDPTMWLSGMGSHNFYDYAIRNVPKEFEGEALTAATRTAAADFITRNHAGQYALEQATANVSKAVREYTGQASDKLIANLLDVRGEVGRQTVSNIRQAVLEGAATGGDDAIRQALVEEFAAGRWRINGRWLKRLYYGSTSLELAQVPSSKSFVLANIIRGLQRGRLRMPTTVVGDARNYGSALDHIIQLAYYTGDRSVTRGEHSFVNVSDATIEGLIAQGRPTQHMDTELFSAVAAAQSANGAGRVFVMTEQEAADFAAYGIFPDYLEQRATASANKTMASFFDGATSEGRTLAVRIPDMADPSTMEFLASDAEGRLVWVSDATVADYYITHFIQVLNQYNAVEDPVALRDALRPKAQKSLPIQDMRVQKRPIPEVLASVEGSLRDTGVRVPDFGKAITEYAQATHSDIYDVIASFRTEGLQRARTATGNSRTLRELVDSAMENAASHGYQMTRDTSAYTDASRGSLMSAKAQAMKSIGIPESKNKINRMLSDMITASLKGAPGSMEPGKLLYLFDEMKDGTLLGKYMWAELEKEHVALYGVRIRAISKLNIPEPIHFADPLAVGPATQSRLAAERAVEAMGFPKPTEFKGRLSWDGMIQELQKTEGMTFQHWNDNTLAIPWDARVRGTTPSGASDIPVHALSDAEMYATLTRFKKNAQGPLRDLIDIVEQRFNKIVAATGTKTTAANSGDRFQWVRTVDEMLTKPGVYPHIADAPNSLRPRDVIDRYVIDFNRQVRTAEQEYTDWAARVEHEMVAQQQIAREMGKGVYVEPTVNGYHPDPSGRFSQRFWDNRKKQWTALVKDVSGTTISDPSGGLSKDFVNRLPTQESVDAAARQSATEQIGASSYMKLPPEQRQVLIDDWFGSYAGMDITDGSVFQQSYDAFKTVFPEGDVGDQIHIDFNPHEDMSSIIKDFKAKLKGQRDLLSARGKLLGDEALIKQSERLRLVMRYVDEWIRTLAPHLVDIADASGRQWSWEEVAAAMILSTKEGFADTTKGSTFDTLWFKWMPGILEQLGEGDTVLKTYVVGTDNEQRALMRGSITRKKLTKQTTEAANWLRPEAGGSISKFRTGSEVSQVADYMDAAVRVTPVENSDQLARLAYMADQLQAGTQMGNQLFDTISRESMLGGEVGWVRNAPPKPIGETLDEATPRINNLFGTADALADELDIPGLKGLVDEMRAEFSVQRIGQMMAPGRIKMMEDAAALDHVVQILRGAEGAEPAHEAAYFLNTRYSGGLRVNARTQVAKGETFQQAIKQAEALGEAHTWLDKSKRELYRGITLPEVNNQLVTLRQMTVLGGTETPVEYIDALLNEVARASSKAKGRMPKWQLAAFADALTHDSYAVDEVLRIYTLSGRRAASWNDARAALGAYVENTSLWGRIRRGAAEMALKALQKAPEQMYVNLATNRNLQASHIEGFITELAAATKFNDAELGIIRERAVRVADRVAAGGSEEEISRMADDLYWALFEKHGVSREAFHNWRQMMRDVYAGERLEAGKTVRPQSIQLPGYTQDDLNILAGGRTTEDVDGNLVMELEGNTTPQVLAQRSAGVRVFTPDEILNGINRELMNTGRFSGRQHPIERAFLWMEDVKNIKYTDVEGVSKEFFNKTGKIASNLFSFWKVMVTSRLYMGPLMFAGSLIQAYQDDNNIDSGELWRSIMLGVAGTTLGMTRYRSRMSIINRVTAWLRGGHVPTSDIPGLTEFYSRNARAVFGDGIHALSPGHMGPSWWTARQRVFREMTDDWILMRNTDKMFAEEYARILNYQLRPEEDQVVEIYLRHFANGATNKAAADAEIAQFLGTEEGALWSQRAHWTTSNPQEAVDSTYNMVSVYAGRQEVAAARMAAIGYRDIDRISVDQIRAWDQDNLLAPVIHAQKSESIFRNPQAAFKGWSKYFSEAAYGSANAPGYRAALMGSFADRYETNLIRGGMDRAEAHSLAEELATKETNRILFRHDNATIAARKLDFLFPFTAHRQFTTYMWTRLAAEKAMYATGEAVFATATMARAFNALKEDGSVLRKDSFGNYVFTVPGSAQLSSLLGAPNEFELDSSINGFMAITSEFSIESSGGLPLWAAYGGQWLPHPGGPAWSAISTGLAKAFPDFFDPEKTPLPKGLYHYLWPMGFGGGFTGGADAQVWGALLSTAAPWEMLNEQGVQYSNRLRAQIVKELIAEYQRNQAAKKETVDPEWFPSKEQIDNAWGAAMQAWTMTRMLFPSAARWRFKDADTAQQRFALFRQWSPQLSVSQARRAYLRNHPEDWAHLSLGTTKRNGKTPTVDFKQWMSNNPYGEGGIDKFGYDLFQKNVAYKTPEDLRADVERYARQSAYYTWIDAIRNLDPLTREEERAKLDKNFPEEAGFFRQRGLAREDLAVILTTMAPGQAQNRAIDKFRLENGLSFDNYNRMAQDIMRGIKNDPEHQHRYNYWATARDADIVYKGVMQGRPLVNPATQQLDAGVVAAVSQLQPVEQTRFWTEALVSLWNEDNLVGFDPHAALRLDGYIKAQRSQVYNNVRFKELMFPPRVDLNRDKTYNDELLAKAENGRSAIAAVSDRIAKLTEQIDAAAKAKNWRAVGQLAKERSGLYTERTHMQNYLFADKEMSTELHSAIMELTFVQGYGDKRAIREAQAKVDALTKQAPLFHFDEEAGFDNRNTAGQTAYVADMVNRLNMTPEEGKAASLLSRDNIMVPTRLTWDYLTDFQKSLLEAKYPASQINAWKDSAKAVAAGSGRGRSRSIAQSEIQYAYAMLKKYSQRGNMPKPAAYVQYLALPNNPVLRNQFLTEHPDVADYIRKGGLANMPPVMRYIVQDIMIRNGKWQGDEKSMTEITELAFAREQLQRYTRRRQDEQKPQSFDLWLHMPDGSEKEQYLRDHPEISDWIQRGPMANMPEMYRDVVRDIMFRYNEWTTNTASDGISGLMQQYLTTPDYARTEFLAKNPSLAAYLTMLKSPEEQQIGAKATAYFAIRDVNARRAYLQMNPDVQQYFLTQRTKRYERFLNQVAQYMGSNPELFHTYLDQSETTMKDLLTKFAEPHMVQEAPWLSYQQDLSGSSEGNRQRGATR